MNNVILPPFLKKGDRVAIVSPAGAIDADLVDGAIEVLKTWGLRPEKREYTTAKVGRFAGYDKWRCDDLQKVLDDPTIAAVLCSRGGYGTMRIIDKIDFTLFRKNPKWLIGFSDITVLHAALNQKGYASIHGAMAKAIAHEGNNRESVEALKETLFGNKLTYTLPSSGYNRRGKASGQLVGGNLSLLYALLGTSFNPIKQGAVLFIEDVSEALYHVDRMLQALRLAGVFERVSGLIVGEFSDVAADPSMLNNLETAILEAVGSRNIPVIFDFPAGHGCQNMPLILGANVDIVVGDNVIIEMNK
ncbi:MAG: LD-carboxypeptidase [Paludibacteraceae bacterium]|nr:LD-carboxypeptidase [Paludibacteraceae bacterium]